jgi:hypothetical protein
VSFLYVHHSGGKEADLVHRPGDFLLDITFVADSAFNDWESGEPQPEQFPPPEQTKSEVCLLLIQAQVENRQVPWLKIWNEEDYPEADRATLKWGSADYKAHFQRISMAELVDRDAVVKIASAFRKRALGTKTV